MKKWSMLFIALLLTFSTSLPSFAEDSNEGSITDEERRATNELTEGMTNTDEMMEELLTEWDTNGYPDNVGYVYYDNDSGKYIIGLVNADESSKNEIKSMLPASENLIFETATYSYNDLLKVQDKIEKEMDAQTDETRDIHSVAIGELGENGKEPRVIVGVDKSSFDDYTKKFETLYGDMVYVEVGGPGVEESTTEQDINRMWLYTTFIAMLGVVMFGALLIKRNRLVLAKQTVNGGLVAESRPLRRSEVISAVKESVVEPSDHVYKAILKEIKDRE